MPRTELVSENAPAPNAEHFQALAAALRRAMTPIIDVCGRTSVLRRSALDACGCRCGTHPEFPGSCSSHAEPGLTVHHVPMCRNCHDIRMGLAPQREAELEAVTETCTCHCWANHPDAPGICEAASDDSVAIDGSPVCLECAGASC
ncbi:hypothetical protein ACQB60_22540 [Actinomycetota bacterium Odt1-20B]